MLAANLANSGCSMLPRRFFHLTFCVSCLAIAGQAEAQPRDSLAPSPAEAGAFSPSLTLTLDEALRRTEDQSPAIAAAKAGVEAARGQAEQAGLRPNPEASLEVENFGVSDPYSGIDQTETTLALSQRLELGNKRGSRRDAALALIRVAELRLATARADAARNTRDAYAAVIAAQERLQLARQVNELASELSRVTATLVEVGREPPLRALRAEAAQAESSAEFEAANAEFEAAKRVLTGFWAGTEIGDLAPYSVTDVPLAADLDPSATLEVQLAEAELRAASLAERRERTAGRPDVTTELGLRRFEESGSHAAVFGVSMPLPIADRNQGNIRAAAADILAAEARRNQAQAEAVRTIRDADSAHALSLSRLVSLDRAARLTGEALSLARRGYEAGKFSLIDVFDAQRADATTQANAIEARRQRALAESALLRAAAR